MWSRCVVTPGSDGAGGDAALWQVWASAKVMGPVEDDACSAGMDESLVDWGRSGAGNPGEGRLGAKGEQAG